jgi:hypothetical protein
VFLFDTGAAEARNLARAVNILAIKKRYKGWGQNVEQTQRYGITRLFVPHIPKNELKLMQYLYNRKKWTGWELNPRPQISCLNAALQLSTRQL